MTWQMARRAERLNPSTIREILKITERPGIISLVGSTVIKPDSKIRSPALRHDE